MGPFYHEQLHRDEALMARLADGRIALCGAAALGANIAESLARAGCGRLGVIDPDRVEEHILSTQPYQRADVGSPKARILLPVTIGRCRAVGSKLAT